MGVVTVNKFNFNLLYLDTQLDKITFLSFDTLLLFDSTVLLVNFQCFLSRSFFHAQKHTRTESAQHVLSYFLLLGFARNLGCFFLLPLL